MNKEDVLGAFLLVNNPIVLSEEETKDVQKAIKQLQQENKILKENAENNDKVVDKVNWENMLLKKENEQLKENYSKLEGKYFANVPCCNENDCDLYRDYMKLKDNWNKLKEIAKSQSGFKKRADLKGGLWFEIDELLDKMQELEQGSD